MIPFTHSTQIARRGSLMSSTRLRTAKGWEGVLQGCRKLPVRAPWAAGRRSLRLKLQCALYTAAPVHCVSSLLHESHGLMDGQMSALACFDKCVNWIGHGHTQQQR